MQKIINRKYATAVLYEHLSHGADLIQARGMKRLFEYHALKNHAEVACLQRRMANREWKSAFPDMQEAISMLSTYKIDLFKAINPKTVANQTYVSTIKNLIESCLEHEKETIQLLNAESKNSDLEDFHVYEKFAQEADCLCKELMRMITHYNKYEWVAAYIENDQRELHDCYEKQTEEKFKMYFC